MTTLNNDLIAHIERAFATVAYPGKDDLTSSTYGEEPVALKRDFGGKEDWRSLDADFLDQAPEGWGSALSFFSDRALQFYLPAYLIADLRGALHTASPEFRLCWGVTPPAEDQKIARQWGGGTIGEHARRGFGLFDAEQVAVIVKYLWWKMEDLGYEDPVIMQALDNYWLARQGT